MSLDLKYALREGIVTILAREPDDDGKANVFVVCNQQFDLAILEKGIRFDGKVYSIEDIAEHITTVDCPQDELEYLAKLSLDTSNTSILVWKFLRHRLTYTFWDRFLLWLDHKKIRKSP